VSCSDGIQNQGETGVDCGGPCPACGGGPGDGLCSNPTVFSVPPNYSSGNLGTGATCHETTADINAGNCSNFVAPRTLSVNGTVMDCGGWSLPAKRNGGYCIQTTAGDYFYAAFATWVQ
jgi:hypothetical protein